MGKKDHQDYGDNPHTFFGFLKIRRLFGKFRLPELRLRYKILLYLFIARLWQAALAGKRSVPIKARAYSVWKKPTALIQKNPGGGL